MIPKRELENPSQWKCPKCGNFLGQLVKDNLVEIDGKDGRRYEICAGSIYVTCNDCGVGNWAYAYPFIPIRGKAVSKDIFKKISTNIDRDDWEIWDRSLRDNIFKMNPYHSRKFKEGLTMRQSKILGIIVKEKLFNGNILHSLFGRVVEETKLQIKDVEKEYRILRKKLYDYHYPELKTLTGGNRSNTM
ncbi:MAG: hypothetical protein EXS48_01650 [Candidatus Staskawiczbacteria bacterium]|nr:hypothetical protein [Candidatus Staskawiczbacteria bacterium]